MILELTETEAILTRGALGISNGSDTGLDSHSTTRRRLQLDAALSECVHGDQDHRSFVSQPRAIRSSTLMIGTRGASSQAGSRPGRRRGNPHGTRHPRKSSCDRISGPSCHAHPGSELLRGWRPSREKSLRPPKYRALGTEPGTQRHTGDTARRATLDGGTRLARVDLMRSPVVRQRNLDSTPFAASRLIPCPSIALDAGSGTSLAHDRAALDEIALPSFERSSHAIPSSRVLRSRAGSAAATSCWLYRCP